MPLFWRRGFAEASLHQLEVATGVNKSGLYSEFKDKEDLFIQSLQYYLESLEQREDLCDHSRGLSVRFFPFRERIPFSRLRSPHLVAEALIDRLIDKYEAELPNKYDELRKIIDDWWMRTASREQIRAYAAYCRELAKHPSASEDQRFQIMAKAIALEELRRAVGWSRSPTSASIAKQANDPCDLFEQEKPTLQPLPLAGYDISCSRRVRATNRCRVAFESNRYTVPFEHAGALAGTARQTGHDRHLPRPKTHRPASAQLRTQPGH